MTVRVIGFGEVLGELERATEEVIRRISVNVTAELVEATPVDTGWARANWVPKISFPADSDPSPSSRAGRQSGVAGASAAQQAGIASLVTYDLQRGPVFISNGVPYIVRLNEGTSQQAPAMFVQRAIADGIRGIAT